jgi:hypothetical protein
MALLLLPSRLGFGAHRPVKVFAKVRQKEQSKHIWLVGIYIAKYNQNKCLFSGYSRSESDHGCLLLLSQEFSMTKKQLGRAMRFKPSPAQPLFFCVAA